MGQANNRNACRTACYEDFGERILGIVIFPDSRENSRMSSEAWPGTRWREPSRNVEKIYGFAAGEILLRPDAVAPVLLANFR